jgi:mRNA interferase MazF
MMKFGRQCNMTKAGDVIITKIQFTDTNETKIRPALVLFEEYDNCIVAGITSNPKMQGIPLTKKEGAIKNSIIKINYIFTISKILRKKKIFSLSQEKKKIVFDEIVKKLKPLSREKDRNI